MWGCDGDDGAQGPAGAAGPAGSAGPEGPPGADGQPPDPNSVAVRVESAKAESCAVCHDGVGEGEHQSEYDKYTDASTLAMTFSSVTSAPSATAGKFDVTLEFSITKNGVPFIDANDLPSMGQKAFYAVQYNSVTRQYLNSQSLFRRSSSAPATNYGDIASNGDGTYTLTVIGQFDYQPDVLAAPFDGAQVYGYIAQGPLLVHEGGGGGEFPAGTHVHLYDDVSNTALAFGTALASDPNAYDSAANVSGCENCHGQPYLKHGYRSPEVDPLPDFAACKDCHYDDRDGGHEDWQYMVDDPVNWATAGLPEAEVEAKYAYKAKLMNDVHMAHSMEFPYPRSMANCSTCHAGKLDRVLDNSNFKPETCKSCHPVGEAPVVTKATWPWLPNISPNTPDPDGLYAQDERAPPLAFLWALPDEPTRDVLYHLDFIDNPVADCQACHKPAADGGIAPLFSELHTGYDPRIQNAAGDHYADLFTASIDDVAVDLAANTMTISYRADASAIANAIAGTLDVHVYVSFFGWDSKHFIVPSHTRDTSGACQSISRSSGNVVDGSDCRYEVSTLNYTDDPANAAPPKTYNNLFPSLTELAPGSWELTADLAAWTGGQPGAIPDLIADGTIKKAMITLAPRLDVDIGRNHRVFSADVAANLNAVTRSVDLNAGSFVDNYFSGTAAVVDVVNGCNDCHDQLAVTWHTGSGRGGDIMACKNCHNPTYPGSHVEMASRSVENYVHAIHSFQDFDVEEIFHDDAPPGDPAHGEDFDPVFAKRYDQHIQHVFPNFTIRNCEACHLEGTFDVPDQSKSMPGLLSAADDVIDWYEMVKSGNIPDTIAVRKDERNIGGPDSNPETVVGPASRACGGCHRAAFIKADDPGGLAAWNAHTEAFGTFVKNDTENEEGTPLDDEVLFGIIDKIMSLFK